MIFWGKKAKFRRIFRGKFAENSANFVGFWREKSANLAGFSQEKSQNSQKIDTLTDKEMLSLWWQVNLEAFGIMLEIQLLEKVKTKNFERRKIKPVSTRIQRSETKRNLQWLFELDYQTFQDISLPSQWSNSHCPTDHFCSCWVEVILYSLTCTKRYEHQWSCNASMITEYGKNMLVYTYEIDFLYKSYTPHS